MAIQKIEVIDNNKVGDCDLLSVHNPLVYVVKMTLDDSGDAYDDVIEVDLNTSGGDSEFLGTFYATFLRQDNANERIYIFNSDEILRAGLDEYKDFTQDFNSKTTAYDDVIDEYLAKGAYLTFRADASGTPIEVVETLTAVNAARDFEYEDGACLTEICENTPQVYIGAEGKESYTYDYADDSDLLWFFAEIPDDLSTGNIQIDLQSDTYSFSAYFVRGISRTNGVTNEVLKSQIIIKDNPVNDNDVQRGANRQETLDNVLAYCNSVLSPTITNFSIRDNVKGTAGFEQALYCNDRTGYYKGGHSYVAGGFIFWRQSGGGFDGKVLSFDYTTPDGLTTTNVSLTQRTTPTLSNEFLLTNDDAVLRQSIEDALVNTYPSLSHIVISGSIYFDVAENFGFQEPIIQSSLGGFTNPSTDETAVLGETPTELDPEERNPVFLRKKIEVDSINPFDVVMRTATHVIYPKELCEGDYYIKYLDKNGQYRFMIGEKPNKQTRPRKIGDIDRIITSLRTDLGSSQSVGERGNNIITVNFNNLRSDLKVLSGSEYVYLDEVALLEDLYNSPDVQLEIQDGKWIDVLISGGGTVRQSNKNSYSTSVRLSLPEKYNITKL